MTKTPHPCTPSSLDFSPSPNYTEKAGTGMNVMKKLTFGGFRGFSRDLIKGWVGVPTWLNVPTAHKRSLTPKPPPLPSPASAPTLPVLALTQAPSQTLLYSMCDSRGQAPRDEDDTSQLACETSARVGRWAPEQVPHSSNHWPLGLLSPQLPSSRWG